MKSLCISFSFFISLSISAADVCKMSTSPSIPYHKKIEVVCTEARDSVYLEADLDNIEKKEVEVLKRLIDKGYEIKASGILVK